METVRDLREDEHDRHLPIYCVWELTLRCDQACTFCGSRAARARPSELTTAELLEVADQLAALGTREVTVIGGEAYLRPDLPVLVRHLSQAGVRVSMQTAGRALTPALVAKLAEAGLASIGLSVMGPPEVHDKLHGWKGAHAGALRALEVVFDAGLPTTANTHVCRLNRGLLRETLAPLKERGIRAWRVGLMVPMGRFADHPDLLVEPSDVVDVIDTLAQLQLDLAVEAKATREPVLDVQIDNTLGYYGPHEQVLRSHPGGIARHWAGCVAGRYSLGIESDGVVKGCPSLPTAPYTGGNVRELTLQHIWQHAETLRFARERTTDELWGFCKGCYYADDCRAGCSFTTHTLMGRRGNNPLCYHRVKAQQRSGIRERLVQVESAPGEPYDFGRFEIVEEPWEAPQ